MTLVFLKAQKSENMSTKNDEKKLASSERSAFRDYLHVRKRPKRSKKKRDFTVKWRTGQRSSKSENYYLNFTKKFSKNI